MPLDHTNKIRDLVGDSVLVVDPIEDRCLVNMVEHGQQVIFTGDNPIFDTVTNQPMRGYIDAALAGHADEATRLFKELDAARDIRQRWIQDCWKSTQLIPIAVIRQWTAELA